MSEEIKLGKYNHYKGGEYEVMGVANHSETLEKLVLYKKLYDSEDFPIGSLWVRPLEMFKENVEVDGEVMPRFKYIG